MRSCCLWSQASLAQQLGSYSLSPPHIWMGLLARLGGRMGPCCTTGSTMPSSVTWGVLLMDKTTLPRSLSEQQQPRTLPQPGQAATAPGSESPGQVRLNPLSSPAQPPGHAHCLASPGTEGTCGLSCCVLPVTASSPDGWSCPARCWALGQHLRHRPSAQKSSALPAGPAPLCPSCPAASSCLL